MPRCIWNVHDDMTTASLDTYLSSNICPLCCFYMQKLCHLWLVLCFLAWMCWYIWCEYYRGIERNLYLQPIFLYDGKCVWDQILHASILVGVTFLIWLIHTAFCIYLQLKDDCVLLCSRHRVFLGFYWAFSVMRHGDKGLLNISGHIKWRLVTFGLQF